MTTPKYDPEKVVLTINGEPMEPTPLELRFHNAIPGWCKIIGLRIKEIPLDEGGGYMILEPQARLIVAAHEMLEALEVFKQVLDQDWGDDHIRAGFAPSIMLASAIEKAKAALKKAKGE